MPERLRGIYRQRQNTSEIAGSAPQLGRTVTIVISQKKMICDLRGQFHQKYNSWLQYFFLTKQFLCVLLGTMHPPVFLSKKKIFAAGNYFLVKLASVSPKNNSWLWLCCWWNTFRCILLPRIHQFFCQKIIVAGYFLWIWSLQDKHLWTNNCKVSICGQMPARQTIVWAHAYADE